MKVVKLSEICTFSRGLTYSKSDEVDFSSNVILRANNIDLDSNSLNLEDLRYIKDSIKIKEEKIAKKNSLIICTASGSKTHVGKVALIDEDYGYAFGGFMGQLTPSDKCHPKFLYYVLTSGLFKDFLMSLNDGTSINNLKFSDIENYEVPLPTVKKQGEIVKKLDFVFTDMDTLIKEAELNRNLLRQIYEQEIENIFYRNTNGWPSTTIEKSCDYKNGKAHEQLVDPAGNYRLVTSKFVSSNGKLARRVTEALTPLVSGDVAFVLSDLPNGKALAKAYLVESEEDLTLNQRVLRVKSSKFIPKFLYLQVNRHPYLLSFDNGESQTHLKLAQALSCPLLIPVLNVQKQTAERLIELRSEVEHSEKVLDQKVLLLSALRQSFLFQAFDHTEPAEAVA